MGEIDPDIWGEFSITPSSCLFIFLMVLWVFIVVVLGVHETVLAIGIVALLIGYIYFSK